MVKYTITRKNSIYLSGRNAGGVLELGKIPERTDMKEYVRRSGRLLAALLVICLLAAGALSCLAMAQEQEEKSKPAGLELELSGSVQGGAEEEEAVSRILGESRLTLKVQTGPEATLVNLGLDRQETRVVSLLVGFAGGKVSFSLPGVSEKCYEFDPAALASSIDLEGLIGEMIASGAFSVPDAGMLAGPEMDSEEVMQVLLPYFEMISGHVVSHMTQEETVVELQQLGEQMDGTVYTWQPDEEELTGLLNDLADRIEEDEKLADMIEKTAAYLRSLQGILTVTGTDDDQMDAEEAADSLEQAFTDLPSGMRELARVLEEEGLGEAVIRFTSSVCGGQVVKPTAFAGEELQSVEAVLERMTGEQEERLCLYFANKDGEHEEAYRIPAVYGMDGSQIYTRAALEYRQGEETATAALLDSRWDLKKQSEIELPYGALTVDTPQGSFELSVKESDRGGTDHQVSLHAPEGLPGSGAPAGWTICLRSEAGIEPEQPRGEAEDISHYSLEDLGGLLQELGIGLGTSLYQGYADLAE